MFLTYEVRDMMLCITDWLCTKDDGDMYHVRAGCMLLAYVMYILMYHGHSLARSFEGETFITIWLYYLTLIYSFNVSGVLVNYSCVLSCQENLFLCCYCYWNKTLIPQGLRGASDCPTPYWYRI